jgi:lipase chaperone LimK
MQKHKLWLILLALILGISALVFWLAPSESDAKQINIKQNTVITDPSAPSAPSPSMLREDPFGSQSQRDTVINCQLSLNNSQGLIVNEQTRNCFEYFITQYGEKNLNQIKQDFEAYIRHSYAEPGLSQILDLWKRYLEYRTRLGHLKAPNLKPEDPQYYESLLAEIKQLRQQLFSSYEIEGLFGTEDIYNEYTLKRMAVMGDNGLSEVQKAQKLKALFDQLPTDWKENLEQIHKLEDLRKLTADIKHRGGSAEEIYQMRMNLVGAEATQRLENLDHERADWKNKVENYLTGRNRIIQSSMSDEAKQKAIQQLRNQHFNKKEEQLRLSTFETVYDKGEKLPFAD